ncbi:MAG: hypothetical protein ORN55_00120 [Chitinophagaceae bacterium]|nr:hypothetical protein [Chitinophagaceae bacterium]
MQKENSFTYEVDEHCKAGKHQLEINSIDENGNTKVSSIAFEK